MNSTEAQLYVRLHNCGCGNALSFRGAGDHCEIICPGNPEHHEFVRVPSPTERYKAGEQLHPVVQRNIERRMGVTMQPGQLDSRTLMVIGETAMAERLDVAMKAQFGFALDQSGRACTPTPGQIRALIIYCATYGLDPLRHEVVLFGGNPLVGLDAYRRKATETGDYLGCSHRPVIDSALKEALGFDPLDIVDECTVRRLVKGHIAEFSRYGGVRRKEIDAMSQSGSSPRHPVLHKFSAEMAQNRAEKHALRAAFQFTFADAGSDSPIDTTFSVIEEGPGTKEVTPAPGAPDDKGQPPTTTESTDSTTPGPSSQEPLFFDVEIVEEKEPEYTVPEKVEPSQFQFLMGKMGIKNKAKMNETLGIPSGQQFNGSPKDAVDSAFAALLAQGCIPAEIKHWAQWLTKS